MSKILSYNKKTTGEGWISLHHQYATDEIEMIEDPNGGLAEKPRTAIPSPFAQFDLLKNAFKRLSLSPSLDGDIKDKSLVSNALDVAQLFFNYNELKATLRIIEWNRENELERLKASTQHALLGETLEMFMEQDKESFNFELMDRLYFLMYGNEVIGSTSPVTLFMATPNAKKGSFDLPIEQNVKLFDEVRMLADRDPIFVKYIYALFTANPSLKQQCGEMNDYFVASFSLLTATLQNEILLEIGSPTSVDLANVEKANVYLNQHHSLIDGGVQVLGIPFYCLRQENILTSIAQSDFIIAPTKQIEGALPLVLQNNLSSVQTQPYRYITSQWSDNIKITLNDYALEPDKRTLPGTTHVYPWLSTDDFLEPSLIKLDYTLNKECFFDGNLSLMSVHVDDCDFLLPLKPLFFEYFSVKDLKGRVGGHPCFEMEHHKEGITESLTVILRIPVQKSGGYITLKRTYLESNGVDMAYDVKNDRGTFVRIPFALNIFPFVQTKRKDSYSIQLIDRALGLLEYHKLSLSFYKEDEKNGLKELQTTDRHRSLKADKRVETTFYRLQDNFDCVKIQLNGEKQTANVQGLIIPNWVEYMSGHENFTFAVDFGTTNTHVEVAKSDGLPEPFALDSIATEKMVATLYNGESVLYDALLKQEFLPKVLGIDYHFPLRTVLSESNRLDVEHIDEVIPLGDTNIPFSYEKESIGYGNRIIPNLKWSSDISASKRVKAFLTELALLMRAKVLIEHGDIMRTSLVWFYPLSMKVGNIRKLEEMWRKIIGDIWGIEVNEDNLIQMPESVAPYYYYKSSSTFRATTSTIASIDIGGGTSDVAVFDGSKEMPLYLSSFRFAANSLFGDAFSDIPQGDKNPLLTKYVSYFKHLFDADEDKYGELNGILTDITDKRKSEEINAFLFSVINHKAVNKNDVFSYNIRLNEDSKSKIIFLYFYAALIYYVANTMKHLKVDKPRNIMFSGTGSKVLDIVGSQRDLDLLTQTIIEKIYNEKYDEYSFSVILERKEPKQITCRGALMQVSEGNGRLAVKHLNTTLDGFDNKLKANYSMLEKTELLYEDMEKTNIQQSIVERVKEFNTFFIDLCEQIRVVDRFLVDNQSFQLFKEIVNFDLSHHLVSGWKFVNKNSEEKNSNDVIEDTLFFYPIIGSIRNNLIERLLS